MVSSCVALNQLSILRVVFFIELSRFAVCEYLAEEMMIVAGKLAPTPPHWLTLKKSAPELPWHLVQSLLQQQRVSTSVLTPVQAPSESSLGKTGASLVTPNLLNCRVFVSTLPKTKSEVSIGHCTFVADFPDLLTNLSRRKLARQLPCDHFLAHRMMAALWRRPLHQDQGTSVLRRLLVKGSPCLCDSMSVTLSASSS